MPYFKVEIADLPRREVEIYYTEADNVDAVYATLEQFDKYVGIHVFVKQISDATYNNFARDYSYGRKPQCTCHR